MTTATREEAPRHFSTSVMKSYVFTLCEDISVFHYISLHFHSLLYSSYLYSHPHLPPNKP